MSRYSGAKKKFRISKVTWAISPFDFLVVALPAVVMFMLFLLLCILRGPDVDGGCSSDHSIKNQLLSEPEINSLCQQQRYQKKTTIQHDENKPVVPEQGKSDKPTDNEAGGK